MTGKPICSPDACRAFAILSRFANDGFVSAESHLIAFVCIVLTGMQAAIREAAAHGAALAGSA